MKTAKRFDCVKMKNDIQARLAEEYRGLTDEQIRERIRRKLARSKSPVARLWRSLTRKSTGRKPHKESARRGSGAGLVGRQQALQKGDGVV